VTTALRLPSGAIVAAAEEYDSDYRLENVIVRSFTSDGAPTRVRTFPRKSLAGMLRLDGLLPAPDGGTWVVMSSRKSVELIPVP